MKLKLNKEVLLKLTKFMLATSLVLTVTGCAKKTEPKQDEPAKKPAIEEPITNIESETPTIESEPTINYQQMNIEEVMEEMKNQLNTINTQLSNPLNPQSAIGAVAYINKRLNEKDTDYMANAEGYMALGMLANADLSKDGKFDDVWYNLVITTPEENQEFINKVLLPIETAYTSGDFSKLMIDLDAYAGKTDNHWNNVSISMLHYIMQNKAEISAEDKQKMETYFEDLYYQYYDGKLFSQSESSIISRHA